MDNSAVAEAITVDGILHWLVVSVGINAQTVYFVMTEIKAGSGNAFDLTVGGNPVNCAVRLIGVPGTIFNDGIIRFSSYNESKTAHNFLRRIIRRTDLIIAIGNVFQDVF